MAIPVISIAAQLGPSLPIISNVVATKPVLIRGFGFVAEGTPTVVNLAGIAQPRQRRAQRQIIAFKRAGVLVDASAAPTITGIAPTTIDAGDGPVTVTGTGFEVGADITLRLTPTGEDIEVEDVVRVSATSMTFVVPVDIEPGEYYVRVSDSDAAVVSSMTLTVTEAD